MFEDESTNDQVEEYKYNIYTAKDLVSFALAVNSGDVKASACLCNDIDLSFLGNEFVPIGSIDNPFRGVFHGKGHRRLHSLYDWKTPCIQLGLEKMDGVAALFGVIGDGAEIMNVIVKGRVKCSNGPSAGLIGMIQGEGSVSICRCANEANIISEFSKAAGIVARVQSSSMLIHMRDVYNIGSISSEKGITAGICGCQNNQKSTFVNVFNGGVLKGSNDAHFVRGALGKYINCYSTSLNKDLDNADIKLADKSFMESGDLCLALNANRTWDVPIHFYIEPTYSYTMWYQKIGEDSFPCFDRRRGKVFPKDLSDLINAYMIDNVISEENMPKLLINASKIGYGEKEVKMYLTEVKEQAKGLEIIKAYLEHKQKLECIGLKVNLEYKEYPKLRKRIFYIYLLMGFVVCSIYIRDYFILGYILYLFWGGIVAFVLYMITYKLIERKISEQCAFIEKAGLQESVLHNLKNILQGTNHEIYRTYGINGTYYGTGCQIFDYHDALKYVRNYNISAVPSSLQTIKNYVEQFSSSKGDVILT